LLVSLTLKRSNRNGRMNGETGNLSFVILPATFHGISFSSQLSGARPLLGELCWFLLYWFAGWKIPPVDNVVYHL